VDRSLLETFKVIFTSEYWLLGSLMGAFFSFFALNRGGVVVFIEIGACFVVINLLLGEYRPREIPFSYWATLGILFYLLVASFLFSNQQFRTKYVIYILRAIFVLFTIHCLSQKQIDLRVYKLLPILWCFSVGWQFAAVKFFKMPFGTYSNPHYLANFMISILPLIVFSFWSADSWYKWVFVIFALMDVYLLLKSGSRPAIFGLTFSSITVIFFFIKSRLKWIGLLAVVFVLGIIYVTNYGGVANHLHDLLSSLKTEERISLWKIALQMLENNSITNWIFGNGIGSYSAIYPDYSGPQFKRYFFPHFHPFGILYENGIIGFFMVFGGFTVAFVMTLRALNKSAGKNISLLLKCMLVIFMCWMIHSSLTVPFYSKYAQYPLGFILGTMLVLINQSNLPTINRTAPAGG